MALMAKFEKGHTKIGGRQSGTPNKVTQVDREFITALLDRQAEKMETELSKLTGKDYWSVILALNEYRMPKIQRVELKNDITHTDQVKHIVTIKR